jgi:3-hydroxyisobutyrate dehydrogenase-like beta-hydroxyacid dehydrogenase
MRPAAANTPHMRHLGLIGAGAMGEPIGAALLKAGFSLHTCAHVKRERVERLVAAGAVEHADPAAVGQASDAVVLMLPDAPQVEEALFAARGVLQGLRAGGYVIDMSTISPLAARAFHERLAAHGIRMLDAPVSGGPARAAAGDLAIMVGAQREAFVACEPVFRALGRPQHVGPPGMGETVKLVNQMIIASVMQINAEALVFAKKAGADIDQVRRVIAGATGANYLLEKWLPNVWFDGARHAAGFALDLLRKDLNAALDTGRGLGVAMPLTELAARRYAQASAAGSGAKDYSAVAQLYEEAAGVKVAE